MIAVGTAVMRYTGDIIPSPPSALPTSNAVRAHGPTQQLCTKPITLPGSLTRVNLHRLYPIVRALRLSCRIPANRWSADHRALMLNEGQEELFSVTQGLWAVRACACAAQDGSPS
jgi:hypothetical protein